MKEAPQFTTFIIPIIKPGNILLVPYVLLVVKRKPSAIDFLSDEVTIILIVDVVCYLL